MKINEHKLAVAISKVEGKKVETNIAQIKEVLDVALTILANYYPMSACVELIERHEKHGEHDDDDRE